MISIVEQTELDAKPEAIWKFFGSVHEGDLYQRWHPRDHRYYRLLKGVPNRVGSQFRFSETIGRSRLTLTCRVTRSRHQRLLEYTAVFPLSLLRAGRGRFEIVPKGRRSIVVASVEYGYRLSLIGRAADRLVERWLSSAALRQHMREEGRHLAKVLSRWH